MKSIITSLALLSLSGCAHVVTGAVEPPAVTAPPAAQTNAFGPLAALAGTRWYAVSAEGSSEAIGDVQYWYWEFGGGVLAQRHALEDGSYGGVTYVFPKTDKGELKFIYITSGGFSTQGAFVLNDDGSWTALEDVEGHETITQVRSTGRIDPEGLLQTRSEYFQSGEWVPGHAFVGRPTDRLVPEVETAKND